MITSTFLAATRSASCTRQLVETTTRPELGCPAQYGCEPGSPGETPLSLTAQDSTTQSNEQAPKRATRVTGHRGQRFTTGAAIPVDGGMHIHYC